jgi:cell division protein FtsA
MNDPAVLAQRALRDRLALALREGVIAAIDLGDTETKCVIARVDLGRLAAVGTGRDADEYSALRVIGTGTAAAAGATGGEVEAPARAAESIRLALDAAQAEAGVSVHSAIFCLGDGQPRTLTASTSTAIPAAEVDDATVARLMATCRPELALRLRRPILVEPGSFTVDGVTGIRDPRGKPARTLGMLMSVLTVEREALKAIMQAATLADLGVDGIVSSGIASAVTCLTNDELELGAVCIDMGSSITVHAGFREGRFQGAGVVPIGGERITADLAAALSLSMADAEALKVRAGGPVSADPSVLGGASGGSETSTVLVGVVRPRLEEIFEKIRLQLEGEKPRPVVLTGGASQLPGVIEVAKAVLGRRARLGRSLRVPGAPADAAGVRFSSALGALAYAIRCDRNPWAEAMENVDDSERRFNGIFDWLRRNW